MTAADEKRARIIAAQAQREEAAKKASSDDPDARRPNAGPRRSSPFRFKKPRPA